MLSGKRGAKVPLVVVVLVVLEVLVVLRNMPVAEPKILDLLREVLGRVVGCEVHW